MAKRPDLNITDYHDLVELFHEESDRGAAILAASFVEQFLGVYLRSFIVADAKNLFGGFGPLASFSQRIDCAHAFGHITTQTRDNLHRVRKIRNHFAHNPKGANFADQEVRAWVEKMSFTTMLPEEDCRKIYLIQISLFVVRAHNKMLGKAADYPV